MRKLKFFVVYVTGLEAESTTSCPDQKTADDVARIFKRWARGSGEKPVILPPGSKIPEEVRPHVVRI